MLSSLVWCWLQLEQVMILLILTMNVDFNWASCGNIFKKNSWTSCCWWEGKEERILSSLARKYLGVKSNFQAITGRLRCFAKNWIWTWLISNLSALLVTTIGARYQDWSFWKSCCENALNLRRSFLVIGLEILFISRIWFNGFEWSWNAQGQKER